MLIDLGPVVRRLVARLLMAGVPLAPLGCGERSITPVADGGSTSTPPCVPFGGEPKPKVTQSCSSPDPDGGWVVSTFEVPPLNGIFAFDPADPRWAASYAACVAPPNPADRAACEIVCADVTRAQLPSFMSVQQCGVTCDDQGRPQVAAAYYGPLPVCGRRPEAFVAAAPARGSGGGGLGELLAQAAELEAASVPAFRRLARELGALGAPQELIAAARAALGDEADHWRRTRAVAERHGGRPVAPRVPALPLRGIEEVAIDNAVEGCVRETYGAAVALWQGERAQDPAVRELMSAIAADEVRHAELAFAVDAWADVRLSPAARARRARAVAGAVAELAVAAAADASVVDPETRLLAGLPDANEAGALLDGIAREVWSPGPATSSPAS
jgi:hypothetical protein